MGEFSFHKSLNGIKGIMKSFKGEKMTIKINWNIFESETSPHIHLELSIRTNLNVKHLKRLIIEMKQMWNETVLKMNFKSLKLLILKKGNNAESETHFKNIPYHHPRECFSLQKILIKISLNGMIRLQIIALIYRN